MSGVGGLQMTPDPHGQSPAIARNNVLLPDPEAPTIRTRSPVRISAVASSIRMLPSFSAMERFSKLRFGESKVVLMVVRGNTGSRQNVKWTKAVTPAEITQPRGRGGGKDRHDAVIPAPSG
jgi:hypothetical protein